MTHSIKKQLDSHIDFEEWYYRIINDFKFDRQRDIDARDFLSRILKEKKEDWSLEEVLFSFNQLLKSRKHIFIYGCGPSLEETVNYTLKIKERFSFATPLNLVADGAARLLIRKNIPINGIFTDLDGITRDNFNKSEFIVVHAHGDNINQLDLFKNEILSFPNFIGTTQVEPIDDLVNSGGFTDGDRILFFIASLLVPIHEIYLIGMDFNSIVGKYSKPEMQEDQVAEPIKLKKLQYGLDIIEWLLPQIKNPIYFVNSQIGNERVKNLTLKMFENKIIEN
jgi:uncharacterized Rossmann fold enzyme